MLGPREECLRMAAVSDRDVCTWDTGSKGLGYLDDLPRHGIGGTCVNATSPMFSVKDLVWRLKGKFIVMTVFDIGPL